MWTKDSQRVEQGGRVELSGEGSRLELVIRDVRREDEGLYQCMVITRVGDLQAPLVTTTITEFRVIGKVNLIVGGRGGGVEYKIQSSSLIFIPVSRYQNPNAGILTIFYALQEWYSQVLLNFHEL